MHISFNGTRAQFLPEEHRWLHQSYIATQFTMFRVDDHLCFVKRQPQVFSGWNLLGQMMDKQIKYCPATWALNRVNGHYYYFAEGLGGDVLETRRSGLDVQRLVHNVFVACYVINRYGYWFSDLCRKNVFVTDSNDYFLIDVDSSLPHSLVFHNRLGVCYEYAMLLNVFVKETGVGKCDLVSGHSGECVNQAMLVAFAVDARFGFGIPVHVKGKAMHAFLMSRYSKEYASLFGELADGRSDWVGTKELVEKVVCH
jgi:hypothetical protein